jgi:hypothetical protein
MNKIKLLFFVMILPISLIGQKDQIESIYRRSSLFTMMINEPSRQYAEEITKTFISTPLPEKFNDHNLNQRQIDNTTKLKVGKREENIKIQEENISDYLIAHHVARDLVAKWFNRKPNGTFDMDLIAERGSYNATEMDVKLAKSSERGLSLLSDAGEELIHNTFVVVNDFDFVSKEEVANTGKKTLSLLKDVANKLDVEVNNKKIEMADVTLTTVGKGYLVRTTSYLYQLDWNDSVAAVFYNNYWMDANSVNKSKKFAFDNSDIFKLKYVGYEVAYADLQATVFTKKTELELVDIATVRAIDHVIAKLQRKYEVFRTKTPLYNNEPLSAKIGLKEDLEKGDKFEVLEQVQDKKGHTTYRRKGVIRVDKDHIWDNRFMATEEHQLTDNLIPTEDYTIFKGDSKYYIGWMIRQIN